MSVIDRLPTQPATPREPEGWEEDAARPAALPASWRTLALGADGGMYERSDGLRVITSAAREEDGKRWLHVSCSRRSRVPPYEELVVVRNLFIGDDRAAIQVFPPRSRHISIHRYCLHLWCCLDGSPLPDFARGGDSI